MKRLATVFLVISLFVGPVVVYMIRNVGLEVRWVPSTGIPPSQGIPCSWSGAYCCSRVPLGVSAWKSALAW